MLTRIRLLSALQSLSTPSLANVSDVRCRAVVAAILDLEISELPNHPPQPQDSLEAYLSAWLGLELA